MEKTNNYAQFKFNPLNRSKIYRQRVQELVEDIKQENLLHMRPIIVNKNMEIHDGNHRVLAAQQLGVPIYYEIQENLKDDDILMLNNGKPFGIQDYFNFYLRKGYPEYLKLENFMKTNGISFYSALFLSSSSRHEDKKSFRKGKYFFSTDSAHSDIDICNRTVDKIKDALGEANTTWLKSGRFFKTLALFVRQPEFEEKKWFINLTRMATRCGPRVSKTDYTKMLAEIYNYRNNNKISLDLD